MGRLIKRARVVPVYRPPREKVVDPLAGLHDMIRRARQSVAEKIAPEPLPEQEQMPERGPQPPETEPSLRERVLHVGTEPEPVSDEDAEP